MLRPEIVMNLKLERRQCVFQVGPGDLRGPRFNSVGSGSLDSDPSEVLQIDQLKFVETRSDTVKTGGYGTQSRQR